jgi:lipid II:glycine glycyltransferase (peptidoglycan interpeptide bridge formation enzyme)
MLKLLNDYSCEVDSVDEGGWYRIVQEFDDASIYQTWAYDAIRCDARSLSHLVLRKNDRIVAAAQARILKIPWVKIGIAYVRWGPMWRTPHSDADEEVFRQAIRSLRNEFSCRRGLVLRIYPHLYSDSADLYLDAMEKEGFFRVTNMSPDRTLLLDLSDGLEELRKGLRQKWRNQLNAAERNGLEIVEGTEDELFQTFTEIYREMAARKSLPRTGSIDEFRRIQQRLPDSWKLRVFLCRSNGTPCAGAVCSTIGKTGIYLFGATNDAAMKNKASYLIQWKIVEWLKKAGCRHYDLHGINPSRNPGTYTFKSGLSGSRGRDVHFLGFFDAWRNPASRYSIQVGDALREAYRKASEAAKGSGVRE